MYVICEQLWKSVTVYRPEPDIDRLRRECLSPYPLTNVDDRNPSFDTHRIMLIVTDRFDEETWNFHQPGASEPNSYSFDFDTHTRFPTLVFDRLAAMFPKLALDCECIADDDSSMGYGWFNPPPGGLPFRDDVDIPKDYWTNGSDKRDAGAERQHLAYIAILKRSIADGAP